MQPASRKAIWRALQAGLLLGFVLPGIPAHALDLLQAYRLAMGGGDPTYLAARATAEGRFQAEILPVLGADGAVYFAALDASFYALEPETGDLRWRVPLGTNSVSSAAVRADGAIILGADDGFIRALNPANGAVLWRFDTRKAVPDDTIESSPLLAPDGSVVAMPFTGQLQAGLQQVPWDGSGVGGSRVADGTYTVQVTAIDGLGDNVQQLPLVVDTVAHPPLRPPAATFATLPRSTWACPPRCRGGHGAAAARGFACGAAASKF